MQLIEGRFGHRLYSAYLIGSRSSGREYPESDLDIVAILRFRVFDADFVLCEKVRDEFYEKHKANLDISLRGFVEIMQNGCEYIRLGSTHLYGAKLDDRIPLPQLEKYRQKTARLALAKMREVRGGRLDILNLEPPCDVNECKGYLTGEKRGHARLALGLIANLLRFDLAQQGIYIAYKHQNFVEYHARSRPHSREIIKIWNQLEAVVTGNQNAVGNDLNWSSVWKIESFLADNLAQYE